jgi:dTDP-4-dehydrorhamnose 3,5-epimerase
MNRRLHILDTPLPGLKVIHRRSLSDDRGYFERLFCVNELQTLIGDRSITQINHTLTVKPKTVRGMHFQQPPYAEVKFITCLRGQVFDVSVDIRSGSPTFLQWHGELLSADNHKTLVVPEGFAHGFQTLSADCELLYFHTAVYEASAEAGLHARDPTLGIRWPHEIAELSPRDAAHPALNRDFSGVEI